MVVFFFLVDLEIKGYYLSGLGLSDVPHTRSRVFNLRKRGHEVQEKNEKLFLITAHGFFL